MKVKTITVVLLIPKLQSHFAEFLQLYYSIALVYSTHPPVSDFIRSTKKLNKFLFKRVNSLVYAKLCSLNVSLQEPLSDWIAN